MKHLTEFEQWINTIVNEADSKLDPYVNPFDGIDDGTETKADRQARLGRELDTFEKSIQGKPKSQWTPAQNAEYSRLVKELSITNEQSIVSPNTQGFSKEYLEKAADPNRFGRYLISVEQAQQMLQQMQAGTSQNTPVQPQPAPAATPKPQGFSKEYLQKAADPNRFGRYLISVERAQQLLQQMNEDATIDLNSQIQQKKKELSLATNRNNMQDVARLNKEIKDLEVAQMKGAPATTQPQGNNTMPPSNPTKPGDMQATMAKLKELEKGEPVTQAPSKPAPAQQASTQSAQQGQKGQKGPTVAAAQGNDSSNPLNKQAPTQGGEYELPPGSVGDKPATQPASTQPAQAAQTNKPLTWQEIYQQNKQLIGANPNLIKAGQQLKIRSDDEYTVRPGDSLSKIAGYLNKMLGYTDGDTTPTQQAQPAKAQPAAAQPAQAKPAQAKLAQAQQAPQAQPAKPAPTAGWTPTPEQEKWLGGADRQDPYILNRMPGEKPPVSYFTDPADQQKAKQMGFPASAAPNTNAPAGSMTAEGSSELTRLKQLLGK